MKVDTERWISTKAIKSILLSLLALGSFQVEAKNLKVLILKDGSKPYAENASGDVLSTFNKAVLGQLLLTTNSFELSAGLLKSWKWIPSDGSYELSLRENLKFHDGSPVKSDDLEFALLRGFFSSQRSFYEIYLGNILGVEKIVAGTKFSTGLVEGVKIAGPYTIRVKLRNPNPSFLYALTRPYFSFSKRAALNDDLITWKKWPVGAGDYKVDHEDLDLIKLVKVSDTELGEKTITLYKRPVTGIKYDVSFFQTQQPFQVYKTKDPSAIYTLFYTNQNALSADKNFRAAVRFGIDRKQLIEGDDLSKPAYEFLPSTFWKNNSTIEVGYNLDKAKEYFAKVPKDLRDRVWRIPVFAFGEFSADRIKINSRLESQFIKFGLKVQFYPSTEKFLSKQEAIATPFAFSGRICNNVDRLLMFSSFKSKSPYKYDNAQNDVVYDKLFEEAAKAVSTEDRVKTLRLLSRYTVDNDFMMPLYENAQSYLFNPDTIGSFGDQNNAITLFLNQLILK